MLKLHPLKVKVKVLIWYSTILYVLYIFGGTLQPNPQQELTQPWYQSSPWGDSDQHVAYIPCRASASAVLPYIFAGTHFTYPQRDGRLSQPVECSTAGPSHVSHYGAMPAACLLSACLPHQGTFTDSLVWHSHWLWSCHKPIFLIRSAASHIPKPKIFKDE